MIDKMAKTGRKTRTKFEKIELHHLIPGAHPLSFLDALRMRLSSSRHMDFVHDVSTAIAKRQMPDEGLSFIIRQRDLADKHEPIKAHPKGASPLMPEIKMPSAELTLAPASLFDRRITVKRLRAGDIDDAPQTLDTLHGAAVNALEKPKERGYVVRLLPPGYKPKIATGHPADPVHLKILGAGGWVKCNAAATLSGDRLGSLKEGTSVVGFSPALTLGGGRNKKFLGFIHSRTLWGPQVVATHLVVDRPKERVYGELDALEQEVVIKPGTEMLHLIPVEPGKITPKEEETKD